MLKKRIIACFDIKDGRTVKGINFLELKDAGNAVEMASAYAQAGIDELVFLDITATQQNRKTLTGLVEQIAANINIPFTVGGGINSVEEAETLIRVGADKISVNSSAIKNPSLLTHLAMQFGSQAVVAAIDVKQVNGNWEVFSKGGTVATGLDAVEWAQQAEALGAGEILLTCMNSDGTKNGFALDITNQISKAVNIPVIASGGAGACSHFRDVFYNTGATGALAASVFHFGEISIPELKQYLKTENIAIR